MEVVITQKMNVLMFQTLRVVLILQRRYIFDNESKPYTFHCNINSKSTVKLRQRVLSLLVEAFQTVFV